jgi:hypothetical protein
MNEPQAINTVGSPLAPQGSDGRQQYALPLLYGAGMAFLNLQKNLQEQGVKNIKGGLASGTKRTG